MPVRKKKTKNLETADTVNDPIYGNITKKSSTEELIPIKITAAYIVFGALWVIFSDRILDMAVRDKQLLQKLQIFKGCFYVVITACVIYVLIARGTRMIRKSNLLLLQSCMELEKTHEELGAVEEELRGQLNELQGKEKELQLTEERFRLAMEGSNDDIWDWDIGANEAIVSERWREMLGIQERKSLGHYERWKELIHPGDVNTVICTLKEHFAGKTQYYYCEYRLRTKNGQYIWILGRGKVLFDENGDPVRMAGSHTDISQRKGFERRIQQLAFYDSLTGLPNRAMFEDNLEESIKQAVEEGETGAVIVIGLDNFKVINDTYGRVVGDMLLQEVASLLRMFLRKDDIVSRSGGDEFAILYRKVEGILPLTDFTNAIIEAFRRPWIIDQRQLYSTISVGIALYPRDGKDAETVIRNVHSAIHCVKEEGRDGYQFYTPKMNLKRLERLELESRLRGAMERQELFLLYQPQVDIKTGSIIGVEALLRWRSPEYGIVNPTEFIPVAETSGLIVPIGEWVLRTACLQCVEWQRKGMAGVCISVNLSVRQFQQVTLKDRIESILMETKLEPSLLELEITESIAMKDLESAIYTMKELSRLGIKLSLDDFGTGYSSLNYLKKLPIDTLKIDKSFLCELTEGSNEDAIAQAIIHLSHSMNLTVVAEGVESQGQLEFLKQNNCDRAQGYLFGVPLTPEEFENMYWYNINKNSKM